jgi:hypothetical protein
MTGPAAFAVSAARMMALKAQSVELDRLIHATFNLLDATE